MTIMKNIIKYGLLTVFLLFAFLTNAQICIDFEDGNSSNWTGYGLNSLPHTTSQPQNLSNPSTYLTFTDGSGGSVAVNHLNFSGNWLEMAEDSCLCFDYRVKWNSSVGTTRTGPSFAIYQSSSLLNSQTDYTSLIFGSGPHSNRIMAVFVSSSSSPIQNDIWASYCLPIAIATGNSLPSNAYGTWIIRQGPGTTNLTGTAAVNAWNQLIVNVTGLLLDSDYNGQPSEVISFDNFCWDCEPQPQHEPCCDIEDFDASIHESNGTFNVTINGGSVPLQEVEISMVDYHIEYSEDDCKPDDLGIFGTLTTSTINLGALLLNSGDNGTSSLSWLSGSPSIINNSVNLDILYPDVLNLDCCDVTFSFCLKVRVTDVNCNVCEKIICYSNDNQLTSCDCGEWKTNTVSIKGFIKEIPQDPKLKINQQQYFENKIDCDSEIKLKRFQYYSFTAPVYICNPEDCDVSYTWEVVDPNAIIQSGNGKTFNYTFNGFGIYKVIFTPICGGERCDPCIIYVNIEKIIQQDPNDLPHDIPIELPSGDVYNPATGETWMDKNLGASQVATSYNDPLSYGDLYQWGRLTDGHEKRTSSTTSSVSNSDVPGNNKFIVIMNNTADWRVPANNNLWQGVNGINNPCPNGYRLPTAAELNAERLSWTTNDAAGAFASPLKWTLAGKRLNNGEIYSLGGHGTYWSSTPSSTFTSYSNYLSILNNNALIHAFVRAQGYSVRCIKN